MQWTTSDIVIGALLFISGFWLGRTSKVLQASRIAQSQWQSDPSISDAEIEAQIRAGRPIEAIRLYRRRSGAGLKEARQAVDAMAQRLGLRR